MKLKDSFDRDGFVGPIQIMSREEAIKFRDIILNYDAELDLMSSDYRCKSNVLFPFVDEISRNSKLIGYVTELIGPNFSCWDTLFWIKKPGDGKNVSFHQDATYWNFNNKHRALTVWLAFDDVDGDHGSIEYIRGSHRVFQRRHLDIKSENNLLMRGQTVDMDLPKEKIKTVVPAGNVLIHSPYIIHGSGPNLSSSSRVAVGMIFVSTECKPELELSPESTVLVSGYDSYGYMLQDPRPTGNWNIDVINWQKAYDRQHINYYKIEQKPHNIDGV